MLYAIIPYWNDAATLEAAVRSALPHVDRVVLVGGSWAGMPGAPADGSSPDGSDDIARALVTEFPGDVRLIGPRPWAHQMEQRNAALISRKRDDWVLLLDADEELKVRKQLALQHGLDHAEGLGLRCLGLLRKVHGDTLDTVQTRLLKMDGFGGWQGSHHVVKYDGQEYMLHVVDATVPNVEIHDTGPKHRPPKRLEAKAAYDAGLRGGERVGRHLGPVELARVLDGIAVKVNGGEVMGRGAAWVLMQAADHLREKAERAAVRKAIEQIERL